LKGTRKKKKEVGARKKEVENKLVGMGGEKEVKTTLVGMDGPG